MTKTEMVAGVLHAAGFNSEQDECLAFARGCLLDVAGSEEAFLKWDTQVPDEFARRYIEDRSSVTSVNWVNLYHELS